MYNERMLYIENGLFSPMVFAVNGAMGLECRAVFSRNVELISVKRAFRN